MPEVIVTLKVALEVPENAQLDQLDAGLIKVKHPFADVWYQVAHVLALHGPSDDVTYPTESVMQNRLGIRLIDYIETQIERAP